MILAADFCNSHVEWVLDFVMNRMKNGDRVERVDFNKNSPYSFVVRLRDHFSKTVDTEGIHFSKLDWRWMTGITNYETSYLRLREELGSVGYAFKSSSPLLR